MVDLFLREDRFDEFTSFDGLEVRQNKSRSHAADDGISTMQAPSERLEALIADSVIPAIAGIHLRSNRSAVHRGHSRWRASCGASEEFARAVLRGNLPGAKAVINEHLARGMRIDQLYLDFLEPAARSYGRGWVNDDCDFTEVTVGCWRLQQIMHDYSAEFHREVTLAGHHSARIWLSAVPGEQHTFGVSMLREFFVRAGHEVIGMPSASGNVISETVKREYLDVLGLSVAGDVTGKVLKGLIDGVRMYSRNRAIRILIGGAALMENPELCTQVGADGWAKGAREALKMVNNWCAALVVQDGA